MTIDKLIEIKNQTIKAMQPRFDMQSKNVDILVCSSTGCNSACGDKVLSAFKEIITARNLTHVNVLPTGCFGLCSEGPIVIVFPSNTMYIKVKSEDVAEIIDTHILHGKLVERLLPKDANDNLIKQKDEINFFKSQEFIARKNSGFINPDEIDEYIALDGYFALYKSITKLTPSVVALEVKNSGLRGRGGAGFNTGLKWELTAKEIADQKYVVCNADEGDPGAFMDRSIIESNPHKIIEAMSIAAFAVGATKGYVYLRAEYPLAGTRLENAINEAYSLGLLGNNIFGTEFCFDLTIKKGAGAFVCGEETALMASLEGKRGEPRKRPPYPAQKGVFNSPTVLNNVETLACIPDIINKGADWFKGYGTGKSTGTKVFALTGKINNTGLIELPLGTPLREIIYNIGGGIPNGKKFKAVQIGGPSGACIPNELIDTLIDYESLAAIGAMVGSGGMIVVDEDTNMVEFARFFLEFTCDESCGKCTPCRMGTKRLLELMDKILAGDGCLEDLDELENLSNYIKNSSLCGLGQSAPNPIISTLKYFRNEYIALIDKGKKETIYEILPDKCTGCTLCAIKCPVQCIKGERQKPHEIIQPECIKCGTCINSCRFGAIITREV